MWIEEGKFYRTRDGRKVGPAKKHYEGKFEFDGAHSHCHSPDGKYLGRDSSLDIISEWAEGPIVTETVRRIKPGVYGRLSVSTISGYPSMVGLALRNRVGDPQPCGSFNAPELRELARVALEIAEYLDGLD